MRRVNHLFEKILERDTLRVAFCRAARGKRSRPEVQAFATDLDARLDAIAAQLRGEVFPFGRYRQFVIHDPKRRVITAPCFEERVIHHAIVGVCEPWFERWLIDDSFACRPGRGREAAVARAASFAKRWHWHLHLDVRQCFDSIHHETLHALLARRFKDRRLLGVFSRIIGSFRGEAGRGLPIGSLVSQHMANFYLGWFDRFVKETLRVKGYVRYMDDLVLWGESRDALHEVQSRCTEELGALLRLEFKPAQPGLAASGFDFLGCRIRATHVELAARSRRRFRQKVKAVLRARRLGILDEASSQARLASLAAFARAGEARSWRFRRSVLQMGEVDDP